ncbi:unnamed protein product [Somion occarium]|uniref:F-box domain-containing protein n=1 Tax=Somion occarium TaxID=3059160 RepID=A0ABP1CSX9_9APHY
MMPIALADLPAEVLIDILSDACTDSGLTGCSLTLVSRDFRALCFRSGIDIQCAAVYGLKRMHRISADDGSLLSDSSFAMERATTNPDEFPASRLNRILRAISPYHLKTLTIITPHTFLATSTSPSIFTFPFPSLSELTLYACIAPSFFDHSPATPSLKLFHIAAFKQLPNDIGSSISKVPPNLTHLRISEKNLPHILP